MSNWRLVRYQIAAFVLTFFSYAALHSARTSWSYSKHFITNDEDTDITIESLGTVDFTFLFCYAASMLSLGWIGDRVDLRFYIAIGLVGSALAVGTLAILRLYLIEKYFLFVALMGVNGFFQAFVSNYMKFVKN